MNIQNNIPLKNITTMNLGGPAKYFTEIFNIEELESVYNYALEKNISVFIIGGGSNIIANDSGFDGIVAHIKIPGFEILSDDEMSVVIKVGAGEILDDIVQKTVDMNIRGIECLSGIPGTVGATPVQNVGAYGQEIADTLVSLEAYDTTNKQIITIMNNDCKFSYRDSIFRTSESGRYVICSVTLKLLKDTPQPPFYDSLQKYIDTENITNIDVMKIRSAILEIRKNRLPDPKINPNTGSFFKNAIVEQWQLENIKKIDPTVPSFSMPDGKFKIPSGWLIEKAGLKGQTLHGMRVYENNALVLINDSAKNHQDLVSARNEIIQKVRDTFMIEIEQEPLEI